MERKKSNITSIDFGLIKYLLLTIPLKPIFTFIAYPVAIMRGVIPGNISDYFELDLEFYSSTRENYLLPELMMPLGYHIDNIFNYEIIGFLYTLIIVLFLYIFMRRKNTH